MISLPANWTSASLRDLATPIRGISFPTQAKSLVPAEGLVACLRTTNVQRSVEWGDLWYVPQTYVRREEQWLREGDTLVSIANSRELVGKVARVDRLPTKATLGTFIAALRPSPALSDRWFYYQLSSETVQQDIRSRSSTTTNISNVNMNSLLQIEIPVPPAGEQHRIANAIEEHFTRLDAAVAALRRAQANLKRYRASVLKAACEGKLVPTEAEIAKREGRDYESASMLLERVRASPRNISVIGAKTDQPVNLSSLPPGWLWAQFGQLMAAFQSGSTAVPTDSPTDFPILRSSSVRPGGVDFADSRYVDIAHSANLNFFLDDGDLLFIRLSGSLEYVGNCGMVRGLAGRKLQYPDRLFRARVVFPVVPSYCEIAFASRAIRQQVTNQVKSTAGHQRISMGAISGSWLPLPPLAEQHRIADEVEQRLIAIQAGEASITKQLARAERLRQSVLKRAFEGRLVPQDPNDEPAGALLERIRANRLSRFPSESPQGAPFRRPVADAVGLTQRELVHPKRGTPFVL